MKKKISREVDFLQKKVRKKIPAATRALLQKEIYSKCPFCDNEDVQYFEVHHIDDDPSNNLIMNLILLCANCHTMITKGDITTERVIETKNNVSMAVSKIEIYKICLNPEILNWEAYPNTKYAFQLNYSVGNGYPIFQFHLINHYKKTMVLTDVELRYKPILRGFGDLPQPCEVPISSVFKLIIKNDKKVHKIKHFNGIQIPSEQSYILQIELAEKYDDMYTNLDSAMVLYFKFIFSNNISINLPKILINSEKENNGVKLLFLG